MQKIGALYRHYKFDPNGSLTNYTYQTIGTALHTETREELVVYKPLYESPHELFARPRAMFAETIELDGSMQPRFVEIIDPELIARLIASQGSAETDQ